MKRGKGKRIALTLILCFALICAMILSCGAEADGGNMEDRVRALLNSGIVYEDLLKLTEKVDTDDVGEIVNTVLEIYPDFVATAKKLKEGASVAEIPQTGCGNERYDRAVRAFLKSEIAFSDFRNFCETVETKDAAGILRCVFEIYPDIVVGLKKGLAEDGLPVASSGENAPQGRDKQPSGEEETGFDSATVVPIAVGFVSGVAVTAAVTVAAVFLRKKRKSARWAEEEREHPL